MVQFIFDEEKVMLVIDWIVKWIFQMDFVWDWLGGVVFYGVVEVYEVMENEEYINLLKMWVDEQLEDGLLLFLINGVFIGYMFLFFYKVIGDDVYLEIVVEMVEYVLYKVLCFGEGIFQYMVNVVEYVFFEQVWVDMLMMVGLFMLRIGWVMECEDYFEDGLCQFYGYEDVFQDFVMNLYYYVWDNKV